MKENTAALHVQVPVDVATYLLNEKRAEIHAIEARLKMNVILIPNVHLETPNYTITRLRHDDVKLGEVQTSYQMVEKPTEEITLPSAAQESKPPRPQAAVKGITPSQPAPIRDERPQSQIKETSLLSKLFGWFSQPSSEERKEEPKQTRTRPQRQEHPRGRQERGRDGKRSERGEPGSEAGGALIQGRAAPAQRPPRGEQEPKGDRPSQKKPSRPPREERNRTEAKPQAGDEQLVGESPLSGEGQPQQGEDGGRSRRHRGGRQRDRGERRGREDQGSANQTNPTESVVSSQTSLPVESVYTASFAPSQELSGAITEEQRSTTNDAPQQAIEPHVKANNALVQTALETIPVDVIPTRITPVATSGQVEIDLVQQFAPTVAKTEPEIRASRPMAKAPEPVNLAASGLIMIETFPEKVKQVEADVSEQTIQPKRPRERLASQSIAENESLVQIETHKE
jgi:ribonuclease E